MRSWLTHAHQMFIRLSACRGWDGEAEGWIVLALKQTALLFWNSGTFLCYGNTPNSINGELDAYKSFHMLLKCQEIRSLILSSLHAFLSLCHLLRWVIAIRHRPGVHLCAKDKGGLAKMHAIALCWMPIPCCSLRTITLLWSYSSVTLNEKPVLNNRHAFTERFSIKNMF